MFSGKCRNEKGSKKLFALSVVASMVLALGASALTPAAVSAAACPKFVPGKVVRATNKNVYYLVGSQGELKKYINTEALLTWQPNVSRVVKAKAECLKDVATGDDVGYRPGSRIVKFDKKYYAVGPNKTLFELATPAIAKSIYGANWRAYSRNISKAVFSQYTVGTAMEAGVLHNGMLVKKASTKTVYYVVDGTLRKVVGALSAAARNDVRSLNAKMFTTLTVDDSQTVKAGDVVVAPESTNVVTPVAVEPSVSLSPLPSPQPIPPETTPATNETTTSLSPEPSPAPGTISSGLFHNANYTGSFPAPEGLVLKGTYGNDKFQDPTGSGLYRYQIQTAFERPVVCLDSTRLFYDSKGGYYDAGFQNGFAMSESEAKSIKPIYNDTPVGPNAGKAFYNEAYKLAYSHRWNGGGLTGKQRNCPQKDFTAAEFAKYDTDGWYKNENIAKLKTVRTLYTAPMVIGLSNSSQSALGGDSTSLNLDNYLDKIEGSSFSTKTGSINLSRVDFLETDTSAEELALGPEGIMRALFAQQSAEIKKKYGNTLAFINLQTYRPVLDLNSEKPYIVETQTYGKNRITVLQYITAKDGKWNLVNYGLRIDPKTNTGLLFFFYNPKDISNETKNGVDNTKASSDFLAQLLTKMEFANY